MDKKEVLISFVVPCYNEEGNVFPFYEKVAETFGEGTSRLELIFVNDGSEDGTGERLKELYREHKDQVKVIGFSRHFGKEAAMLAGLERATGTYTVIIDADLQQNPAYALKMREYLDAHEECDVVCCVQDGRKERVLSRVLKRSFYRVMNGVTEVNVKSASSDFKMMRRSVVDAVISLQESNRFSRGIFAWVGFNTYYMPYKVEKRASGRSKWSLGKLFKYAFQGIVSFSDAPLILPLKAGVLLLLLSVAGFIPLLVLSILNVIDFSNLLWIVDVVAFFTSLVLISNGLLGRYLSSVYAESKGRPKYVVKEYLGIDREN